MNEIKGALLFPVALLYDKDNQPDALRVVRCRVMLKRISDTYRDSTAISKNNIVPANCETLLIDKVMEHEVFELSLSNLDKDKSLRRLLFKNMHNAGKITGMGKINGVRNITSILADGTIVGAQIYHLLISHVGNALESIHGFFDYTGTWHAGIAEIVNKEPFMSELKMLHNTIIIPVSNKFWASQEQGWGASTCLASMPMNAWGTELLLNKVLPRYGATAADLAAQQLMLNSEDSGLHVNDRKGVIYNPDGTKPVEIIPHGVSQAYLFERGKNGQAPVRTQRIMLPHALNTLHIRAMTMPEVQGLQNTNLQHYFIRCHDLVRLDMPGSLKGTVTGTSTEFKLNCVNSKYFGSTFNLAGIMTDASKVELNMGAQAWDTVILPHTSSRLASAFVVDKPRFNLGIAPVRNVASSRTPTTRAVLGVMFDNTDNSERHAYLDLHELKGWQDIKIATQLKCRDDFNGIDGTKSVLHLLGANPYTVDGSPYRYDVLTLRTDCSVSEEIQVPYIPSLVITVDKLRLRKKENLAAAGTMRIKGNVSELCIVINVSKMKEATKHIYIDGTVDMVTFQLTTSEGISGEVLREQLKRVCLHVRNASSVRYAPRCFVDVSGITYEVDDDTGVDEKGRIIGRFILNETMQVLKQTLVEY